MIHSYWLCLVIYGSSSWLMMVTVVTDSWSWLMVSSDQQWPLGIHGTSFQTWRVEGDTQLATRYGSPSPLLVDNQLEKQQKTGIINDYYLELVDFIDYYRTITWLLDDMVRITFLGTVGCRFGWFFIDYHLVTGNWHRMTSYCPAQCPWATTKWTGA